MPIPKSISQSNRIFIFIFFFFLDILFQLGLATCSNFGWIVVIGMLFFFWKSNVLTSEYLFKVSHENTRFAGWMCSELNREAPVKSPMILKNLSKSRSLRSVWRHHKVALVSLLTLAQPTGQSGIFDGLTAKCWRRSWIWRHECSFSMGSRPHYQNHMSPLQSRCNGWN